MAEAVPSGKYRQIVENALATGEWEKAGIDGKNHGLLRHIPTGKIVTFQQGAASHGDRNDVRNTASDIEKISGHVVWQRGNRRPSKKRTGGTGFDIELAREEARQAAADAAEAVRIEMIWQAVRELEHHAVDLSEQAEVVAATKAKASRTLATDDTRLYREAVERYDYLRSRLRQAYVKLADQQAA